MKGCTVTDLDLATADGKVAVARLTYRQNGKIETVIVGGNDLVFFQNASMTDASSLGSMSMAPEHLTKNDSGGWALGRRWQRTIPEFGNPSAFNSSVQESYWESFTVMLKDSVFFDKMEAFSGNKAGTGGLVTFKDSRWLMSVVLAHQPHLQTSPQASMSSGDMPYTRTAPAISLPNRCRNAPAGKSCESFAVTSILISIRRLPWQTAFPAECPTSQACLCPVRRGTGRSLCQIILRTWPSSANSLKYQRMWFSPTSIQFGRHKWLSISYSILLARFLRSCINISRLR